MSIDWVTVAAQLVNFLVLVWLLKRFLYRPILDGIDARESEIAERMGEASRIKESAETTVADYHQQLQALQHDRTSTLEQARLEAQTERDALLAETRERIRQEQAAARQQQQRQAGDYIDQLHQISAKAILDVVNKALTDLSDETLEERLVLHALATLKQRQADPELDVETPGMQLKLSTRHALDDSARERIRTSATTLWPSASVLFDEDAHQAPGALLQFGSSQIEWTVETYVKELESQLQKQLESDTGDSEQTSTENQNTPAPAIEETSS